MEYLSIIRNKVKRYGTTLMNLVRHGGKKELGVTANKDTVFPFGLQKCSRIRK